MKTKFFRNATAMRYAALLCPLIIAALAIAFTSCSGDDEPTPEEPLLSVEQESINAAYTAGMYPIYVTSNSAWTATVNSAATWCTLNQAAGNANGTVTVNVFENPMEEVRGATVTVTNATLSSAVLVTQSARQPSNILANPLYINFYRETASKPWNNLPEYALGSTCNNMLDAEDIETEISIVVTDAFDWGDADADQAYTLPVAYLPLTGVPEQVSKHVFRNEPNRAGSNATGVLKLTGLRPSQEYRVSFFCAKNAWGDVCATKLTVVGKTEHTMTLLTKRNSSNIGETGEIVPVGTTVTGGTPAEANTTIRVGRVDEMYPDETGSIVVTVTKGNGGNQPTGIHFLSAMWIDPL
ncbi:MAG: BACON domain-containing protein [Prevotellaceae bacterium]|jgi:hypothetical protein|nr:BACON domain-containing protein [Prevotellaceae bacterium]